ncbi:MAG: DUF6282 family protein [Clostridia bacterium]
MNKMISVEGAYDLHVHTHPCLFPRIGNDFEVVEAAEKAGLAGIMLKCHHESTVSRAEAVQKNFEKIKVYGGIVLNDYVGGMNPYAVDAALRMGAKEVWMPTIDAKNHAQAHGSKGKYDVQDGRKDSGANIEGISIYNETGDIKVEVKEILKMIAEYNVILGTCHLGKSEIFDLVKEAKKLGVEKILITHPFFKVPNFEVPEIKELVALGAKAEFGYCTVSPMWHYATVQQVAKAIIEIGASNCIIISDAGQRHNPMPHESLRVFAQCLYECGVKEELLKTIMIDNPRILVES